MSTAETLTPDQREAGMLGKLTDLAHGLGVVANGGLAYERPGQGLETHAEVLAIGAEYGFDPDRSALAFVRVVGDLLRADG